MRLYSRVEGTAVVEHLGVRYEAGPDGGFDFPNELSDHLHSFAIRGEKLWENSIEKQRRLIAEEAARRADPATLLAAVEQLVKRAEGAEPKPARVKAAAK